ncbi:MAG TPA: peptidylprolyl isomerase [Paracoccaceae bacterium]|nr:peptidylprolyl isomerase [Paracoccaceae bacterium]
MIRRSFLKAIGVLALSFAPITATAQDVDPENVLVIDIAGEANGTVEILLRPDVAPLHAARLKELARAGAYDGVAFHRVIEGFMAQTGDVEYGRSEGYDYRLAGRGASELDDVPAEFSSLAFEEGVVGMARSQDPNSANSQFFIMFVRYPSLDGAYTVVGKVISGLDVVNAIKRGDGAANGSVFQDPDFMARVRVKADID